MEQATFSELEHDSKKRRTRRELFLEKMDGLVPWEALEALIEPFYPKPGRGRRPYPLRTMLRVHCVQLWYDLSDPGMEDLLYEVESVRRFVGLRLSGPLPDETTILKFRHLLEEHGLGEGLFEAINAHLTDEGHSLRRGTIVDASIVDAPSSTKKPQGRAGSGDAPDEEGQPVVLRDEGARPGWTRSRAWRTRWRRRRRTPRTWRWRTRCCTATRRRCTATRATRACCCAHPDVRLLCSATIQDENAHCLTQNAPLA